MTKPDHQLLLIKGIVCKIKFTLKIGLDPVCPIGEVLGDFFGYRVGQTERFDRVDEFDLVVLKLALVAEPEIKVHRVRRVFDIEIADLVDVYAGVSDVGFVHVLVVNDKNAPRL